MKKALIVTKEFLGRTVGQVFMVADEVVIDGLNGGYYSENMVKVVVPEELAIYSDNILKASKVNDSWELQLDEIKFKASSKPQRVSEKYNQLQLDVYDEMTKLFKSTKSDSATANLITWMRMLARPAFFAGKGIVCKHADLLGIDLGENLDTTEKVQDYAQQLMDKADAYAVWREIRIQQFSAEKAQIEAE